MSIGRTAADAAPVGTMTATISIVEVTERKNETEITIVIETIDVVERAVEEAVQNHDHGLILHRRRMVAEVVLMDVAIVVHLLTAAEIIITALVEVVTQAITVTATETLIRGIIVITVIIGIGIVTETVTETAMVAEAAMAPDLHLVLSATEVVVEAGTTIVGLVAQAPATDRLSIAAAMDHIIVVVICLLHPIVTIKTGDAHLLITRNVRMASSDSRLKHTLINKAKLITITDNRH